MELNQNSANKEVSKTILVPSIKNLNILPPVVSWVNYAALNGFDVTVFSYNTSSSLFADSSKVKNINISEKAYPKAFIKRLKSKIYAYLTFYRFLIKSFNKYDIIWLPVWDYKFLDRVLKILGFKGKLIYQFHELEFKNFKYCKKVDRCIVPEQNRGWILNFMANLNKTPLLLPNIPYLGNLSFDDSDRFEETELQNKKVILYQGLVSFEKRCLNELIKALQYIKTFDVILAIMPIPGTPESLLNKVKEEAKKYNIEDKVFILNSLNPPRHLSVIKKADLGIGLYRPTSLNQVYAAPNRLYEFLHFGLPIILPNFPQFKYLEAKYPYAVNTVEVENPEIIAEKITEALQPENYSLGKENAKNFYSEEADYNKFGSKILKYLSE